MEDVGELDEEGSGWQMYSAIARMRSCRSRETYFNPQTLSVSIRS